MIFENSVELFERDNNENAKGIKRGI